MRKQFGSKRRAKQEILVRYASLIYMGSGQYGIARGADYYFGRPSTSSPRTTPPERRSRLDILRLMPSFETLCFVATGETPPVHVNDEAALSLVQEGLRGVVRMPGGTAHALGSRRFPNAVMGGRERRTSSGMRFLWVPPTGLTGLLWSSASASTTRSLGSKGAGGRVALPVFKELMSRVYGEKVLGPRLGFRLKWNGTLTDSCKMTRRTQPR